MTTTPQPPETLGERLRDLALTVLLVLIALTAISLLAALIWLLCRVDLTTARLWAGIVTVGLPVTFGTGLGLGIALTRSHLAGLERGLTTVTQAVQTSVGTVMSAASATADVRVRTAQQLRLVRGPQSPPSLNVVLGAGAALPGGTPPAFTQSGLAYGDQQAQADYRYEYDPE